MNADIVESFAAMVREKGVDKDVLHGIIEDIFGLLVRKKFGEEANYSVVVNMDRGDIEIFLVREIVDVVEDPDKQISLDEVNLKGNEDELDVGEEYVEQLKLSVFGRRLINLAKQSLNQRIREIEKELILNDYKRLIGEIVIGDIYQIRKNDILVNHNKNELILPREEQIPHERYYKGNTTRAIVKEVRRGKSGPEIIISRADPELLRRLLEIEVPEVYDGIIEIRRIARQAGERAKVAVESMDKRVDPVGACVGMKGVRIHSIIKELANENIDVFAFSDDPRVMITRALMPGKLKSIELDEVARNAVIYADSSQAAMIVGRNGVNIRLAMQVTGYNIDFHRIEKNIEDYEEGVELLECKHELGTEVYDTLINNRFDYVTDVFKAGKEKLLEIFEDDEELVDRIYGILKNRMQD